MIALSILSLIAAVVCYSISQLQQHGKLKWSKGYYGFWDERSYERKYKRDSDSDPLGYVKFPAPDNFYYKRIARVQYKERWFTSSNLTVMFTDGYHACQHLSFVLFGLSIALLLPDLRYFFLVWGIITLTHFTVYRLAQK